MAKFVVEGTSYDTENLTEHQTKLISSLSLTKTLITELTLKNEYFLAVKKEIDKELKKDLGSKIKDITGTRSTLSVTLSNGRKIDTSALEKQTAAKVTHINFINEQISFYSNQLQVLDTARITYSKMFYETLKGAE